MLYAAWLTTLIVGLAVRAAHLAFNTALLTVPAALLWGLLRSRLARGGLADLFRELGTLRGVRLEAGLAKALGDPGLVLAYRVPGERSYIDGRGQPVALPAPGGDRAAAPVERDGRELAMLVYDASLDDDPSSWGRSPPPPRSRSTTRGCRRSPGPARGAARLARAHRRRRRRGAAAARAQPPRRRAAAARLRGAPAADDPEAASAATRRWRSGWRRRPARSSRSRSRSCASSRAGSIPRCSTTA